MYGYIYKTTNLINGKIYIGQHKHSEFDTNYFGSGTLLFRAIDKYGKDNFKCELIKEAYSQQELNDLEKYYIEVFNSRDIAIGYNLAEGGIGGSHAAWNKGLTKENSESVAKYTETRNKLFENGAVGCFGLCGSANKNSTEYKHTLEKILPEFEQYWKYHFKNEVFAHFHISPKTYELCIEILQLDETNKERTVYLENKKARNFKKSIQNSNSSNKIKIKCVETNETFNSIHSARRYLGLKSNSSLYNALYNNKTCKGYHWVIVD